MVDNYYIVTNNDLICDEYNNIIKVDGDFIDVLIKVRDLCYTDYHLVTHPLPASIRIFYSPVRSIVIKKGFNDLSAEVIENSITTYLNTMGERKTDLKNISDYKIIDKDLLKQGLKEAMTIKE